jgi:hypothetical protein
MEWAYVRVGVKSIPTLDPSDGSTLDYAHPADATLLVYPQNNGKVEKTFWAHRFNKGGIVHASSNLTKEGVDNLLSVSAQIHNKKFLLAEYSDNDLKHDDFLWTNTILMHSSDRPKSPDWNRFEKVNNQFLLSLPPADMKQLPSKNVMFITTAKNAAGDEMITIFEPNTKEFQSSRHLVGQMHTLTNDVPHHRDILNQGFKDLKTGGRVYLYGDTLSSIDIAGLAAQHGLEVIRRGPTLAKSLLTTEEDMVSLAKRKPAKETTVVLNGIPGTAEELDAMGKPSAGEVVWASFKSKIEEKLADHFANRIQSKEDLAKELTSGDNDVLFLFAHFDDDSLYFGTDKISIKEIEDLADRDPTSKPRIAILVVCNAGRIENGERTFFRKQLRSVGEIFVRKGFFQKIVAPDHEIESAESVRALEQYLSSGQTREKGWAVLAENDQSDGMR